MTKKHFDFFAEWAVEFNIISDHEAMEVLVNYMEEQNGKFDRDRFFAYCEKVAGY